MPQLQNHLCRHAAEKPAIHARRSKTNPSNSQTADKAPIRRGCSKVCFGELFDKRLFLRGLCWRSKRRLSPSPIQSFCDRQGMFIFTFFSVPSNPAMYR
jgi:hypothetical protein